jgi:two-component system sensor histidine kinase UhpB
VPVDHAREQVRSGLDEMRAIARRLRPEALDELGLVSALVALTNSVRRAAGVEVERRIDPSLPSLGSDAELVVYRVAQEALTNIARHSGAREARLELRGTAAGIELRVSDLGSGFDPGRSAEGAGIRGMRERALLLGASLDVESAPGQGTTVALVAPRGE